MIRDKKILYLSIIYSFTIIFFIIVLILPLRVIYEFENFSSYYYYPSLSPYFLLIAENVRFIVSRGSIPFIPGLILFILSMILFLNFSTKGTRKLAISGHILGLCSAGLLILSAIINYLVYYNRMINYTPILITIAISITELNIGTMIFTKRNDLETYVLKYEKTISQTLKKEEIQSVEALGEIPILSSKIPVSSSEISTAFCPYCGIKVELDHNFCRKCGNPLKKEKG